MLCAFLWYPLTLWLARLVAMHACIALDPSEQLAAIILYWTCNTAQYSYFSLAPRFCIKVLQDVLKKLVNHQHVREVDLILAPQCGQHTRVIVAVSH